jgi:hypothetical protein
MAGPVENSEFIFIPSFIIGEETRRTELISVWLSNASELKTLFVSLNGTQE